MSRQSQICRSVCCRSVDVWLFSNSKIDRSTDLAFLCTIFICQSVDLFLVFVNFQIVQILFPPVSASFRTSKRVKKVRSEVVKFISHIFTRPTDRRRVVDLSTIDLSPVDLSILEFENSQTSTDRQTDISTLPGHPTTIGYCSEQGSN